MIQNIPCPPRSKCNEHLTDLSSNHFNKSNMFIKENLSCFDCDPLHLYISLSQKMLYRPSQFRDSRNINKACWKWIISNHLKNWMNSLQ